MAPQWNAAVSLVAVAMLTSAGLQAHEMNDRAAVIAPGDAVTMVVSRPPPPPIIEQVAARPGFLWAHGYWRWNGRDYAAVPGHWERVRAGYLYRHPHWERRPDGWHWRLGGWIAQ
jgi:hypothetical protein